MDKSILTIDPEARVRDRALVGSRCIKGLSQGDHRMPQSAAKAVFTESSVNAAEKLIVALDVESVAKARAIVDELRDVVSFFKIGLALQWDTDLRKFMTELLNEYKCQIFLDYKYSDIGNTLRRGIEGVLSLGVNFLTIQGTGDFGEKDLRIAVNARNGDENLKIFLVTVLTSLDQSDLDEIGVREQLIDRVVRCAKMAHRSGLNGVIASGQEAAQIRAATSPEFLIITPGIRPKGTQHDDHKRVATPHQAISNGADYLVVGRPIIENPSKKQSAMAIIEEMQEALDALR